MYARVVTLQLRPGTADESKQYGQDVVLPLLKQVPGFKRAILLQNDAAGKTLVITLLETEAHRDALETTGFFREYRAAIAHIITAPAVVEHYEVVAQTTQGEKLPDYARVASISVHPGTLDESISFYHNFVSQNKPESGFGGTWLLVDWQNHKMTPIHFWETETIMQAQETHDAIQKATTQSAHLHVVPPTGEVYSVSIQD